MLLYMDSFDHYVTADLLEKWTALSGGVTITGAGRHGSAGLTMTSSSWIRRSLIPVDPTGGTIGFSFQRTTSPQGTYFAEVLAAYGTAQLSLGMTETGLLYVSRGAGGVGNPLYPGYGTIIGTGTTALSTGNTYHIEMKFFIHDVVGELEVRINGVPEPGLILTNANTKGHASGTWNILQFGVWSGFTWNMDDLYVLDPSGATPWNTFLGDCRVDARYPTAPGAVTQWTPLVGANWQCVDDAGPNDDIDYNSSATNGQTDTFVVQDSPSVGATIYGIQHCLSVKKSDVGICTVAPVVRHGTQNFPGPNFNPSVAYMYLVRPEQTNPGTPGLAWTEAGFNAAEFGYTRVS